MTHSDTDKLLRWLDGALSPEEAAEWERRMAESPALREHCEAAQALRGALRSTVQAEAPEALAPFFTDRVMKRLRPAEAPRREDLFAATLAVLFRPVLAVCLALIIGLAAYNVASGTDEIQQSPTEAVLGLPPVTLTAAFELDLASTETLP